MEYLNIRLTQPMIGMRTQLGRLDTSIIQPHLTGNRRDARSNKGWTQATVDINTYPSRHSYGFTNHADFAREHGQQGSSELKSAISKHTQEGWANVTQAARPGVNTIHQHYEGLISKFISDGKNRHIVAQAIPDPEITVHQSELTGTPDTGDVTLHAETESFANAHFTRGQVDTYLQQKGEVRQWVTEGHYDIYA